jgi:SAM-dependent methyltransferase
MRTNNQEYWDEQAADYDSLYTSPWWRREDDRVKEWLLRLSLPKDRVPVILDIGCGTGFLFRQLVAANICCEYVGFDISAEMIKNFHPPHREGVHLEEADVADYRWPRPYAPDLIASIYCPLSFSAERWSAVRRLAAKQEPGGLLFLMVLNRYSLRRLLHFQLSAQGNFDPREQPNTLTSVRSSNVEVFYDRPSQVRAAVGNAGYKILHLGGDGPLSGLLEDVRLWRVNALVGERSPALSYSMLLIAEKILCLA